jgi:hypothetical protein
MFTIQNFDKQVGSAMLKKGEQYYSNGAILDLEENSGDWTAEVEGTEVYSVSVSLKNDKEITEYFCDCPYDGEICKHLVAVFFAIREEINERITIPIKSKKKNFFEDLLTKINADEYSSFVKHYAVKNKDFKTAFEIFFADKDDRIDLGEKYTDLIRKLAKKYSDGGFVDYRSSSGLANEVNRLIDKGYDLAHQKNYMDAFAIATAVLKEMMNVLTCCDDSNGSLSGTAFNAIELIGTIATAEGIAVDMKEHIFKVLQTELTNSDYFGYGDFGYNLFSIFEDLAIELNKDKDFFNFIDAKIIKLTGEYDDYSRNFFNTQKINFLRVVGREDEVEKLIQQNLDIVEVRQGEVNKAIDKKDFETAKKLIAGGIKIAEDKRHPGTVSQWKKELLRIAILEDDLTLVRSYCKHFAFDRSGLDTQYYNQWKATYKKDEWQPVAEDLINETIKDVTKKNGGGSWYPLSAELLRSVAPIYIEEKYWDKLFELVKNDGNMDRIMRYHDYLAPHYPAELLHIYLPALEIQGDKASDRSQYSQLAGLMKKLIKDIPVSKEQIIAVAQKLKIKYPRRPAMVDELNKLLKIY